MFGKQEEEDMAFFSKVLLFLSVHWRGVVCVVAPIVLIAVLTPFPPKPYQWCGYTLVLMAIFWVTECIPIAVTSFLPVLIFPLTGVSTTAETCQAYINDSVLMFIGSIILAFSVEQSGLHKRLAYFAIRIIGYSHVRLLLAMCLVTTFVSMWVTNTAATTMMVPINLAVLKVFDDQNIIKLYDTGPDGENMASDITTAYFCAATYSATIGGIGTLVGTATNLAFKGLFQTAYPEAPELLSFPKFSAFAVPYMIIMEIFVYLYFIIFYFGVFRPGSVAAKSAKMTKKGIELAEKAILEDSKKMGRITFWEVMVLLLFILAMIGFFCRSPQIFTGWADLITKSFGISDTRYVRDSSLALCVCTLMFLLPSTLAVFKNFTAKFHEDLPKTRVTSVLDWRTMNVAMPWSFMFLIGGGFALSNAAKSTGLNSKIGETMKILKELPDLVIILIITVVVIFITNFASNVAVANVMCPLAMQLAKEIKKNPLWYCLVTGFCASYCFMIPVGTPGNLVVQSAVNIPTRKMIIAGAGPTITTIIVTFFAMSFWAPVIWPELHVLPDWASKMY
ncbi:protein I'm not dead yet-like [Ostrinia nubilalis]|uniref:protein I'm not dead yet-like n=1 Tax=Ostrinia furnacalis TaxID=93504 RepID=UPI00103CE21B|nr:protein I'm not dead yet-like [Ostrinia furnacalis]